MIRILVRLEGLTLLIASLLFYWKITNNWVLFVLLLLTPDISMIGYLKNKKVGAILYNSVHNYFVAFILAALGVYLKIDWLSAFGFILSAHIGMDRMLGFGLKYPTDFKGTHIQQL